MTPAEYQTSALRTASSTALQDRDYGLGNWSSGLAGEAGEVFTFFLDIEEGLGEYAEDVLVKELGDVLWYIAIMCEQIGISMESLRDPTDDELTPSAARLVSESCKVIDYVKKVIYHKHKFDQQRLERGLGRCYWICRQLCLNNKLDLSNVMESNIKKLRARYKTGFSTAASENRTE